MKRVNRLGRDQAGASSVELALALPILASLLYGTFTISQLFEAQAGLDHALGEGARYATLCLTPSSAGVCTVPTDAQISSVITGKLFGPAAGLTPGISTDATTKSKTITLTYTTTPDFLLFSGPTVTITRSRKVYYAT